MSESVDIVREHVDAGAVSGQTLVLLFQAVEEAAQRHDVDDLDETVRLAQQVVTVADAPLRGEAERLLALCEERLAHAASAGAAPPGGEVACPGCGRAVAVSAVRCRDCGTLLA
jgi:hypothetical protein